MAHPLFNSDLQFPVELLALADEAGRPIVVLVAKLTLALSPDGRLSLAEEQRQLSAAGQHHGDETSSLRYEPETAFIKLTTDVALVGHAYPLKRGASVVDVGLKVGPVQKIVRVFGDRYWVKSGGQIIATRPQPFDRIPLVYERAFGGWDRSHKDESKWSFDPRNPVGRGFGDPLKYVEEGKVPLPNLEEPSHLISRYGDTPPPAGFGFISAHWQHRARYAGTYDDAWATERKPLLPVDFDRRFFNAASPGLVSTNYLRGDEDVVVVNTASVSPLKLKLPGIPPPVCRVSLRGGTTQVRQTNLDTVIIDTDEMLVFLLWRTYIPVPNGPHDVVAVDVTTESDPARRATA